MDTTTEKKTLPRARKYRGAAWKRIFQEKQLSLKLIQEALGGQYLQIQFPEVDPKAPLYSAKLGDISSAHFFHRAAVYEEDAPKLPENAQWVSIWRIRFSEETLKAVTVFGKRYRFDFVGDLLLRSQLVGDEGKTLERMSYAKSNEVVKLPTFGKNKPLPFQKAGVAYAMRTKRCFIADEMGLGKTIQAIMTMRKVNKWPWLVVVPKAVKINWSREIQTWLGSKRSVIVPTRKDLPSLDKVHSEKKRSRMVEAGAEWLSSYSIVVINYDVVAKLLPYLKSVEWKGIVFDESHFCKANTMRTRACKDLVEETLPEYTLALSGTPVMNNPRDLIHQLQLLRRLAEFGGSTHFLNRYCAVENAGKDLPPLPKPESEMTEAEKSKRVEIQDALVRKMYENMTELNRHLRSICYVRREKADVMQYLPEKTRSTITMDIVNRAEYERIERDVVSYLGERAAKDTKFLEKISKLSVAEQMRKIKEHRAEAEYRSARAEALARIEMCKQAAAMGKLDSATEWIQSVLDSGEKLVVFATHKAIIRELEERFPKGSLSLTSNLGDAARQEVVDQFQRDKKKRLLIASLRVGGTGIDGLQKVCSNVAFIEMAWTPAAHDQAEDRLSRMKQKNAVSAYYLVAKNTIEEMIAARIEEKRKAVDASSVGDPLVKSKVHGTILGNIISDLTGKKSLM